ncbi:MAG: hypothetical protein ACRDQ5_15385 [Sciscionella sp.]
MSGRNYRRYQYVANPASNPTRKWKDDTETFVELRLLLKDRTVEEKNVLRQLLEAETDKLNIHSEGAVERLNKYAEAFGFVPLIQQCGDAYCIAEGAHEPLVKALTFEQ